MAACELARLAPSADLIDPLLEFVVEPINCYENIPGAGGKSTGDAAFSISYLPGDVQHELQRLYDLSLSLATIHKILKKYEVDPLRKVGRRKQVKRYQKEVPGERVQMDTIKIRPGLYQWTAIDDCTRFLVVALFSRRTAQNTLHFLEPLMDMMPFPIQRLQTDRGREFTAYKVQDQLWEWGIKFRPNRPGAPHLNGKVERVQQTILQEFYSTTDLNDPELEMRLEEWMFYYNWHRVHGSLGETPSSKFSRLIDKTPFWTDLEPLFDVDQEKAKIQSYGRGSRKKMRSRMADGKVDKSKIFPLSHSQCCCCICR